MPKTYTAYFSNWVSAEGRTPAQARKAAQQAALESIAGDWNPRVVIHDGHCLFIFRNPSGWFYLLDDSDCLHGSWPTREEAERSGRKHLAQWLLDPSLPADSDCSGDVIEHPGDLREHRSYACWQRLYRSAKNRGLPDADCRKHADGNMTLQAS